MLDTGDTMRQGSQTDRHHASGTFKRQRDREEAAWRQEQRVEDVLTHTTHIVDAISSVNGEYVAVLNGERAQLAHEVETLHARTTQLQELHTEDVTRVVTSQLERLTGFVGNTVKDRLLLAFREQADRGHVEVFNAVTAHVDGAMQGALAVAEAELVAERQLNRTLVQQLQAYVTTLLSEVKAATSRAFAAEVETMQRDVGMAKMQASLTFAQNRLLRHEQEVDTLMRVVAQLAETSRFAESARMDLRKAKRHVRLLERHLNLRGIVDAVEADAINLDAIASSGREDASPPPAPDSRLRSTAPQYFALKLLEHKDMTLTELVDSWQEQESRIVEAEQRYSRLEEIVTQVQHDALVVHQRYLEEKQRRELSDRRITDMVRERLYPSKDPALSQEVQRLRWAYTEVVDDAAQLAVNLKVSREERARAQDDVVRLTAQVQQLKRDAETDKVARTIQELRDEYATRVRALEAVSERAQTQLLLSQQVSTRYGAVATEATTALQQLAIANAELTAAPLAAPPAEVLNPGSASAALQTQVEQIGSQAEQLLSSAAALREFAMAHGELYDAQVETLIQKWVRARDAPKANTSLSTAETTAAESASTAVGSTTEDLTEYRTLVSSAVSHDVSRGEHRDFSQVYQFALREALTLLSASLQRADVESSQLVDASLADAQHSTELMTELNRVKAERDRLRAQLKISQDLLEKSHITVVERALMHDVPVEDSLNVAEAAERIEVLKDQLAATRQVCERSVGEIRQITTEKEEVDAQLAELRRVHEVLRGHADRLTDRLGQSHAHESALMEKMVALQMQVTDLMQQQQQQHSEAQETTSGAEDRNTPTRLSDLFVSLQETLGSLDAEVTALARRRTSGVSAGENTSVEDRNDQSEGEAAAAIGDKDEELVDAMSRSGMMSVVRVLKETLHKAGLLRASLKTASGSQAAALCAAATSAAATVSNRNLEASQLPALPLPSAETQQRALEYRAAQLEEKLATAMAERQEMHERLQKVEKTAAEKETTNQRLLTISKSVMEKLNGLKAENEDLRSQLGRRPEVLPPPPLRSQEPTEMISAPSLEVAPPVVTRSALAEICEVGAAPQTSAEDEEQPSPATFRDAPLTHSAMEGIAAAEEVATPLTDREDVQINCGDGDDHPETETSAISECAGDGSALQSSPSPDTNPETG